MKVKKSLKLILYLNYLLIGVTLLSYLAPYANPKVLWPISVIAVFYPWLLLMNVLFILFWMVYKLRYSLVSLITILIGFNHFNSFLGFSGDGYQSSPDQIEVMSYNVQNLHYIYQSGEGKNERVKKFFSFIKEENKDVDIICLQELGIRSAELWNNQTHFPHYFVPERLGPAIFSKYPIDDKGQIRSATSTINSCIWADTKIKGQTYRVYNLHMESNKITRTAERVLEEANIQSQKTWSGIKSIVNRYKDNAAVRIEHAERIRTHMADCPYPIILTGDFNDIPQSYLYQILSAGMHDSFMEKGKGFGTTFAGKIPALRIDYILTDKNFEILNQNTMKVEFSDHYPIKSIIKPVDIP